jgi:zinc protease
MHIRNALPRFTVSMIGFLAVALLPDPLRAAVFAPQTFALDNGLQVVVIENHRVPAVTHMVWYKVGSADEPQGLSGIAHLLEHLMFKGTATRPGGEFSAIVARHGGQENAFTSYDYTGYFQTIAKDRLEQVMALEADRMRNLALSDLDLETERLVVLEERRQRVDNEPGALLDEHVDAALFLNHPYRRPVIGWEHEIRSLQREQLLAFYHQWYRPENAVLVIAGDVTANEVRPLAERIYGGIEAGEAVERAILTEPRQQAARRVTLRDTKVRQPYWERVYLAPSYVSGAREHAYALQVLSHILGESATSRLHRKLVVEDQVAVWVHSHYDPTARGPAQFVVSASPTPGTAMGELERRIEALINETIVAVPASEEIEVAKGRLRADAIYSRDSLSTGARIVGEAIAVGLSVDDVERWPERIAEVTLEAVRLAAGVVFDERRSVTALLLPSSEDSAWAQ